MRGRKKRKRLLFNAGLPILSIILIMGSLLALIKNREEPEPKPPNEPLPWELGRPLMVYFPVVPRPYLDRYGNDLGINDIDFYRYNAARASQAPANVFYNLPNSGNDGKYEGHDWTNTKNIWRKEGSLHIIRENGEYQWDEEYVNAVKLWCEEFDKRGIAYIYSLFDGSGLRGNPQETNAYGFRENNNLGLDGGSVDKFFRYRGPWWEHQKALVDKILAAIGHRRNLILELANEPYGTNGTVARWHQEMMNYVVAKKHEMGYGHVQIQINAQASEMNHLSPEYIFVHWQNTSPDMFDRVKRKINLNGYGNRPGKGGQSTDTGTFRGVSFPWEDYAQKAIDSGVSAEFLILDNPDHGHQQIKNVMERNYSYD